MNDWKQNTLLEAKKDDLTIVAFNGGDVPTTFRGIYLSMAEKAVSRHPALLKKIDSVVVFGTDTVVALIGCNGRVELGMYATREEDANGPFLFCKGLVSFERINGFVPTLIAATFLADAHWSGRFASGKAIARILPSGSVNIGSSIGFARVGFFGTRVFSELIKPDQAHRAVAGSPESGPNGLFTRGLEMYGKAKDIEPRARNVLSDWDLTFGKRKS